MLSLKLNDNIFLSEIQDNVQKSFSSIYKEDLGSRI